MREKEREWLIIGFFVPFCLFVRFFDKKKTSVNKDYHRWTEKRSSFHCPGISSINERTLPWWRLQVIEENFPQESAFVPPGTDTAERVNRRNSKAFSRPMSSQIHSFTRAHLSCARAEIQSMWKITVLFLVASLVLCAQVEDRSLLFSSLCFFRALRGALTMSMAFIVFEQRERMQLVEMSFFLSRLHQRLRERDNKAPILVVVSLDVKRPRKGVW